MFPSSYHWVPGREGCAALLGGSVSATQLQTVPLCMTSRDNPRKIHIPTLTSGPIRD